MREFQQELAARTEIAATQLEMAANQLARLDALAMCVAVENVDERSFVFLSAERVDAVRRMSALAADLVHRYEIVEDILFL